MVFLTVRVNVSPETISRARERDYHSRFVLPSFGIKRRNSVGYDSRGFERSAEPAENGRKGTLTPAGRFCYAVHDEPDASYAERETDYSKNRP